ncbi:MAG: tetratricopeptide repeat protein, partial [Aureliella sp.]
PQEPDQTLLRRLKLLHNASQIAPQDARINAAIIQLVLECKDNKNEQVATLRKATAQGIDPESVHFARGTLALLEGRAEEAQTHLSQAAQRGTQLPATLNNMAMAIFHSTDGDLEDALKLADKAVELLPEHPYLHDTRGRILLKLNRYPEAITSLERGLTAPELRTEIYSNLAIAYRQLGDKVTAHEMESLLAKQAD